MNADMLIQVGRLRRPPTRSRELDSFESKQWIIRGLIEMRKAGIFRMVYCDDYRLAVVLPSDQDLNGSIRQGISWIDALRMVEEFEKPRAELKPVHVERKPPTRSGISGEAKTKCL